ncbi:hypothetical protein [Mycolicibacter algericus]|uniref:Major tail protein n=2 Tax=Mycolicibacter algericus TaxID=1288388 RepID=A0A7I9Y3Z2_MYCAL|nr:hypothetical protein [Mycolicibacter algericus]OQZ96915.1 hypothetical protein BST10_10080 [Mycolicibacter algericus DSM 45454]GFG83389.1 hypothetical protein MALGJ_00650 [Mycolicibacter algericus]
MARPSTGVSFDVGQFHRPNPALLIRGRLIAVMVRDARGPATNMSPHNPNGSVNFSPLAEDGQLRSDLLIDSAGDNEGFRLVGPVHKGDGPRKTATIETDDYETEQDIYPYDTTITKLEETFKFTPSDSASDVVRRLRHELPLSLPNGAPIVGQEGRADAFYAKPLGGGQVDRQFLLVIVRKLNGKELVCVDGYPLARRSNMGESAFSATDGEAPELEFKPLPDPSFMAMQDGVYQPSLGGTWIGGPLWESLASTPETNEYIVDLGGATGGDFVLTFGGETTDAISASASTPTAMGVKSALVALDDGYKASDWTVTGSNGGPFTVITPGGPLTGNGSGLVGGTGLEITPA